ncbi:hypothetical protein KDW77_gp45 [Mycobacterium phage Pinnie]|uniref:DUF1508 domain-containing protein n=2 Tax=Pinnievirus TaxID=2948866 RepID=A0A482JDE8_9CAUD|nr:hypothetical protein AVT46_gp48 [Mycobacterium phage MOOREtheMARYer]YP_010051780.1 hypothetical protein KDW77_gp45 [Mycobacterium phage Pinnie]AKF14909.1 hypothetical protein SEA_MOORETHEMARYER_48 [Mycobacterium phage MOOREtheMARYer]QBP30259.1 hypothetical protein SEA_PINNIE_45 [Mycobacterium phage Pinnie]
MRPLYVRQSEAGPNASNTGDYWYTVSTGNGEPILTSKMYRTRARAIRAARAFMRRTRGPVTFSYWAGYTPTQQAERMAIGRQPRGQLQLVTEHYQFAD